MRGYVHDLELPDGDVLPNMVVCAEVFFAGNKELGTSLFNCSGGYWPSTKFLCPTCGEIWGVRLLQSPTPEIHHHSWAASVRPCAEHGDGSLLDWTRDVPAHVPSGVAIYELINATNWIRK